MSKRIPGGIANTTTGQRKRKHMGWRNFDPLAADVVAEDPNDMIASIANTGGNIVATFQTACDTDSEHVQDYAVFVIPLTNNFGEGVKFSDPFSLLTQIEFISATGDHSGSSQPELAWGLGICENASDIDNASTNKYIAHGLSQGNSTNGGQHSMLQGKSYQTAGQQRSYTSNMGANTGLCHATYFVGPAAGSNTASKNINVVGTAGAFSGGSYAKDLSVTYDAYDIANDDASFEGDTQVYLFAWVGSYGNTWDFSSSGTAPVLTCRLRYMIQSDPTGWGGTGS
tara:strand:+ start:481 stop:1332 length:852 start_codon:yes stop_codon:yes gene_type:complete